MDIQTQGIILSYADYREADRIITVYTKDLGKIGITARGARKIKAKLAGHLELFNLVELQLVGKKNLLVASAINIKSFPEIKSNQEKISIAFALAELVDRSIPEQQKDKAVFNLLSDTLKLLESSEKNFDLTYYFFMFNLVAYLGYKPELKSCVECQEKLTPDSIFFSLSHGGIICNECHQNLPEKEKNNVKKIQDNTLKVIRLFFEDREVINKLNIGKTVLAELKVITSGYLQFNLGIEVKSFLN